MKGLSFVCGVIAGLTLAALVAIGLLLPGRLGSRSSAPNTLEVRFEQPSVMPVGDAWRWAQTAVSRSQVPGSRRH
jgi:hypothetical protein